MDFLDEKKTTSPKDSVVPKLEESFHLIRLFRG